MIWTLWPQDLWNLQLSPSRINWEDCSQEWINQLVPFPELVVGKSDFCSRDRNLGVKFLRHWIFYPKAVDDLFLLFFLQSSLYCGSQDLWVFRIFSNFLPKDRWWRCFHLFLVSPQEMGGDFLQSYFGFSNLQDLFHFLVLFGAFTKNVLNFCLSSKFSPKTSRESDSQVSTFSNNSCTTISTEGKLTDKFLHQSSGFALQFQQNVEVRKIQKM